MIGARIGLRVRRADRVKMVPRREEELLGRGDADPEETKGR